MKTAVFGTLIVALVLTTTGVAGCTAEQQTPTPGQSDADPTVQPASPPVASTPEAMPAPIELAPPTEAEANTLGEYPINPTRFNQGSDVVIRDPDEFTEAYDSPYAHSVFEATIRAMSGADEIGGRTHDELVADYFSRYQCHLYINKQTGSWLLYTLDGSWQVLVPKMLLGPDAGMVRRDLWISPELIGQFMADPEGTEVKVEFERVYGTVMSDADSNWNLIVQMSGEKPVSFYSADKQEVVRILPEVAPGDRPAVSIAQAFTEWPPKLLAEHPTFADATRVSPDQRAADLAWYTLQLKRTLYAAGVEGAMDLSGYGLLAAAYEWSRENGFELDLPVDLLELVVTDGETNLVPFTPETGLGYGSNILSGTETHDELMTVGSGAFKHVTIFGRRFERDDLPDGQSFSLVTGDGIAGDRPILLNLPGIDPEVAQGVLAVTSWTTGNNGKPASFAFGHIVYDGTTRPSTRATDLCGTVSGTGIVGVNDCTPGIMLDVTRIFRMDRPNPKRPVSRDMLLHLLQDNPSLRIKFAGEIPEDQIWVDGMVSACVIVVPAVEIPASNP